MSKPSGSLRSAMPETADFIDAARAVFGEADVNAAIKAGVHGAGTFFAHEAGREVGIAAAQAAAQQRACRRACSACRHLARPGMAAGYCGAGRPDLLPAYGDHHPLRRLPADRGAGCHHFEG